jgi:hypothetical protein
MKRILLSILIISVFFILPKKSYEVKNYGMRLEYYVEQVCKKYNLDERLVWAIIYTENTTYPFRHRYEKDLQYGVNGKWYRDAIGLSVYKYYWEAYCSYGAMHVLYGIAYGFGYKDHPFGLQDHKQSLEYGCRYLKGLMGVYTNLKDVVSAYNQGRPKKYWNGVYWNQKHVNRFIKNYRELGGKI